MSRIIKRKKFPMKPMFEEEAILQMELLGHPFFIFLMKMSRKFVSYTKEKMELME